MTDPAGRASAPPAHDPHPQIGPLAAQLRAVTAEGMALIDGATDDQLLWTPDPRSWSVAACFEHLVVTQQAYDQPLSTAIDRARHRANTGTRPYRPRFLPRTFIRLVGPDPRFSLKAPAMFAPTATSADTGVRTRFPASQAALAALLERAEGCDLNGVRFASPVTRLLRLSVGEGLHLLIAHEQRHLHQAARLTQHPGYPRP